MIEEKVRMGFTYTVEVVKDGVVIDTEVVKNLMPVEGLDHMLGVTLKGAVPVTQWYIALFENDYVPQSTDTAATLPALSAESTAYTSATRIAYSPGAVASGTVDNAALKAEFTFNAVKTIRGGFITSSGVKGSTTGTALSVVRFASPKALDNGAILRVTAGLTLVSA